MATTVPANADLMAIVVLGGGVYTLHHCYAFDGFKCLVPSRKDWFRILLTWMLVTTSICLSIWGCGFCYMKHKYGYMEVPGAGFFSVPPDLYTSRDRKIIQLFNEAVALAVCLQVSLNAEEGLYWYHLMSAVRKPRSSKSWLNSSFFLAWIVISIITFVIPHCVIYIGVKSEVERVGKMYTVLGALELFVALTASIVSIKFPQFLEDVRRSGASREVRSRLYFYHEANKLRTFFRIMFAASALTLGADGLTAKQHVNRTRWLAEALEQISFTSYFLAIVVSVTLYLPRTYSSAAHDGKVMIGNPVPRGGEDAVSNALMSLLRENGNGHWDETDLKMRLDGSAVDLKGEELEDWNKEQERNDVLANFISPIAVAKSANEIPTEIRIHIQQEVMQHADGDSVHACDAPSELVVPKKW